MVRSRLVACLVSGLLFTSTAFPQVKINGSPSQQNAGEECYPNADAYEAARTSYLDCAEQLNNARVQLNYYRKQYDDLFDQCAHANDQLKAKLACEQLALLSAGRLSNLQQDYINLAQRGCSTSQLPAVAPPAKNCKVAPGGGAGASNGNATTQPSTMKQPVKTASNAPVSRPAPVHQGVTAQKPGSTVEPRIQSMPSTATTRTTIDVPRQSFNSGSVGGSSPSTANASGGAGRGKTN